MTALHFNAATGKYSVPPTGRQCGALDELRIRLDCLPAVMRDARRWLLFTPDKVPHYASGIRRHGKLDSPEETANFAELDDALEALERDCRFAGVGFALGFDANLGLHWQGLDLDDALDGSQFTTERGRDLYERTAGYAERSPSGWGLHVIGLGPPYRPIKWKRDGEQAIEAYSAARFFTVTGRVMREGDPEDLGPLVERVRAEIAAQGGPREATARKATPSAGDYLNRQSADLRAWLEAHPIEEALAEHGFARMGERWLSPRSDSGVPGVLVLDRLRAVTFHASDAGIGTPVEGDGEIFNAFDLAARFRFGGDRRAAMREILASEAVQNAAGAANAGGMGSESQEDGNAPKGHGTADASPRFRVLSAEELAALPPLRWRVKGVLPAEGLAAVYGPPGSGKSFLALDLLGAVGDGRDWFGHKVESCPVTYCALEGEHGISQRVAAYSMQHGRAPARMRFIAQPFSLLDLRDVKDLAAAIRDARGGDGIVAIDTLSRAAPGADENDSRDMGRLIASAKALQVALGGVALLVHHSGKDATRGLRGHSSLHAALDAAIEVTRDGDRREWKLAKAKEGTDGQAFSFRLRVVDLSFEDDPPTSCVVVPEESPGDAVRRMKLPQGGNQRILWDALGDLLRASPDFGKAGAPSCRPCVRMEAVVEKTRGRLTCPPDRHSDRCRAALTGLVTRGLLALKEGWLWEP